MNNFVTRIAKSLLVAGSLAAGAAHAGSNVYWSVGINAPLEYGGSIGTVFSNGPGYAPAPVYVQPAPVYVAPAPVYVPAPVYMQPRPVYVAPAPVYYRPRPVYYARPATAWVPPGHRHGQRDKSWKHDRAPAVHYSGRYRDHYN